MTLPSWGKVRKLLLAGALGAGIVTPPPDPGYQPAIPRQVPSGSIVTVTTAMSAASIASAYAALAPGDCIQFAPGTYNQNTCFPNGYNRQGVLIRARDIGTSDADPMGGGNGPHFARFTRTVIFEHTAGMGGTTCTVSAADVTLQDIAFTTAAALWPADGASWNSTNGHSGVTPPYISLGTADRPKVLYCEFYTGHGVTKAPYDPQATTRLADMKSPNPFYWKNVSTNEITHDIAQRDPASTNVFPGWGDGNTPNVDYLPFNRIATGPCAIRGNSFNGQGLVVAGCYFHDMAVAIKAVAATSGDQIITQNWMERIYQDMGNYSTASTSVPAKMALRQNVWFDPFGNIYDNGNPHSDTGQVYISKTGGTGGPVYWSGIESSRNCVFQQKDTRGNIQLDFFQMSAGHYADPPGNMAYGVATKVRENLGYMGGTSHGLDLGITENFYVRGNLVFHCSALNNNVSQGVAVSATIPVANKTTNTGVARPNKSLFADNIFESPMQPDGGGTLADTLTVDNAVLGVRTSRIIPDATVFTGDMTVYPTNLHEAYEKAKRQPAYAGMGPRPANIAAFLLGPLDWTGERPFVGWADTVGATGGATVESSLSWVHGGDPGDVLAITPAAGVEWRKIDLDRTTVLTAYSSSPGTVTVDAHYIQLRATAPAQGQTAAKDVTVGGQVFTWSVNSLSTAAFPIVQFSAANPDVYQRSIGGLGANGTLGTLALMRFYLASPPSVLQTLYGSISSSRFAVQILTTGAIRVRFYNAAAGAFAYAQTAINVCDGAYHDILVSWDTTQTTAAAGAQVFVDGSSQNLTSATWAADTISYSTAGATYRIGGLAAAGNAANFSGRLGALWLDIVNQVDLTVSGNRSKFNADQIGTDGSGPTGSAPVVFIVGNAAQFNDAAGINRGSGAKYIKQGAAAVTDVSGSAWP